MKVAGVILIALGIGVLVYGGITYSHQRAILEVGSFKATTTEQKNIPISPIVGVMTLVAGIALLVIPTRRA